MDGVHDLGGMQGFGPVVREADEPVFHHDWERRVFGLNFSALPRTIDAFRHAIERMEPAAYLAASYYEKWLHALETGAVETGAVAATELETWRARVTEQGLDAVPRVENPGIAELLVTAVTTPPQAPVPTCGRWSPGDPVRVRRLAPAGHTRCPRYVRGVIGSVEACLGRHVLPDASAAGEQRDEPLYSVHFAASDVWGDGDHAVLVDLWESYLEPVGEP